MAELFEKHLLKTRSMLASRPEFQVLYIEHRQTIAEPAAVAATVNGFFDNRLDASALAAAVEPGLYRQRNG
jgi:hypothetical protein